MTRIWRHPLVSLMTVLVIAAVLGFYGSFMQGSHVEVTREISVNELSIAGLRIGMSKTEVLKRLDERPSQVFDQDMAWVFRDDPTSKVMHIQFADRGGAVEVVQILGRQLEYRDVKHDAGDKLGSVLASLGLPTDPGLDKKTAYFNRYQLQGGFLKLPVSFGEITSFGLAAEDAEAPDSDG